MSMWMVVLVCGINEGSNSSISDLCKVSKSSSFWQVDGEIKFLGLIGLWVVYRVFKKKKQLLINKLNILLYMLGSEFKFRSLYII
jgi:hypothetical protein